MSRVTIAAVYSLKVALKDDSRVWRSIAIRGDQTLADLHEVILRAFDRDDDDDQLYSFFVPTRRARGRPQPGDGTEYMHPWALDGFDRQEDASLTTIDELGLRARFTFEYLFDFGDNWWHTVKVDSKDSEPPSGRYPRVTKRRGAAPKQHQDLG
jgi:hypothetical protein